MEQEIKTIKKDEVSIGNDDKNAPQQAVEGGNSQEGDKSDIKLVNEEKQEQERTTRKKALFLEAFEKHIGIITTAAEMAGVSRKVYYDWIKDDVEFAKKAMEILTRQRGQVEDRLLKAIHKDNVHAITFYLRNKHPEYKEKLQITPATRTLEDIIDEAIIKENEGINNKQQESDRGTHENTGQEGGDNAVQVQHGAEILLGKENPPEPDTESKAERDK